jgi:iron complex transport system substrate-binding protein
MLPGKKSTNRTRVVSLLPAATETICALGLEPLLVGRSAECDYPEHILHLPICTESHLGKENSSFAIAERLQTVLQSGLSPNRVSKRVLAELKPEVIFTQEQCETCAISEDDLQAAMAELAEQYPRLVSLRFESLLDLWANTLRVAEALGVKPLGEALSGHMQRRIAAVRCCVESSGRATPTVACIDWLDPLLLAGQWMPELLHQAGGKDIRLNPQYSERSPWQHLLAMDPDFIFIAPCGFSLGRSLEEINSLELQEAWRKLRAVRRGRIFLIDGSQYFNRLGPRIVDSIEIAAEILHPEIFNFKHSGWMLLNPQ